MTTPPGLARRLSTFDAVVVGLSAMLGAGVFAVWGPAASAAGSSLLIALAVAAVVAFCNAVASAQLAQAYPSSGGTYLFGREVLGRWWGFVAGWGFVVGKTASCAAMALTFAAYVVPTDGWWPRLVAAAVVVLFTIANLRGVTRTAAMAKVLLAITLMVLIGLLVAALGAGPTLMTPLEPHGGVIGVLEAAGLLFFAFAGYARISTLAEEVRRPEMLGHAILVALAVALLLYAAIGWFLIGTLGADLPASAAPLSDAARAAGLDWAVPAVRVGAASAALGALLALLAGVSRTTLAMAREHDLPHALASVSPRHQVPDRAQIVIGAMVTVLVLTLDVRGAIGFSSLGVLVYYFVANAAALRQPDDQRRWPRSLQLIGLVGCASLVAMLPVASLVSGVIVFAIGVAGSALFRR